MSEDMPALMPYLCIKNAACAIEFYRDAFGAEEIVRLIDARRCKVGHAELRVFDAVLMLADEFPEYGVLSARSLGGSPIRLHLRVPDVDQATERAVAAGATIKRPPADEFYGERTATIQDPFGYTWLLARRLEEVDPAELQRRWQDMMASEAATRPSPPASQLANEECEGE